MEIGFRLYLPGDFQGIGKSVGLAPFFPCESYLYAVSVCSQNTLAKIITLKCELIFSVYFQISLEINSELRCPDVED